MREEAAANEALLIDFAATEAFKFGGGGASGGGPGGSAPPPQATHAPGLGWVPPQQVGFDGYPHFPAAGYGPMDQAANSPPPPYSYPYPPGAAPFPSAGPVEEEKKQKPPSSSFNIPQNNLSASEKPSTNEKTSTGPSKPLNNSNLQVLSFLILL